MIYQYVISGIFYIAFDCYIPIRILAISFPCWAAITIDTVVLWRVKRELMAFFVYITQISFNNAKVQ